MATQAAIQHVSTVQNSRNMFTFVSMDFQKEKNELVKMILDTGDHLLVARVREFIKEYQADFLHTLPNHVKESLERSRQQAERGEVISFGQFKENISQFKKKLRKKT